MLKRIADLWSGFWFIEGPPHGMAAFRILMGIYWLVHWLPLAPYIRETLSDEGMHFPFFFYPSENLDVFGRFYGWLTQPLPMWAATLLYIIVVGLSICIILGYRTRIALVAYVLMYTYYYVYFLHPLNSSFGRMTFIMTAILIFSPCGKVLSLDAKRARQRGETVPETFPLWTARAICVQVFFIYVGTALFKVHSESWNKGEMIYTSLVGDWTTPLSFWLARFDWSWGTYDLVLLSTILFEFWAGLLLFHPRWQKPVFAIGTVFHLQIAVFLSIWQFLFMPMTYVLFVEPYRMRDWVQRKLQRRAPEAAPTA